MRGEGLNASGKAAHNGTQMLSLTGVKTVSGSVLKETVLTTRTTGWRQGCMQVGRPHIALKMVAGLLQRFEHGGFIQGWGKHTHPHSIFWRRAYVYF